MTLHLFRQRAKDAFFDAFPPSRLVRRGPATARRVALTFDDGPLPLTGAYLDALERGGVPATFFVMGDMSMQYPREVREMVRRGHQVASHGWNHKAFTILSRAELRDQLDRTAAAIGPQLTARPWIRPPYGNMNLRVIGQMLAAGYTIALWSFDSLDHEIEDPALLAARCRPENVSPGEVLLFHEGQQWTVDALPSIIRGLRDAGYECVTMADLFAA